MRLVRPGVAACSLALSLVWSGCGPSEAVVERAEVEPAGTLVVAEVALQRAGDNAAVYFEVTNDTGQEQTLVGVTVLRGAAAADLHETLEEEGVMRMRPLEPLRVAAGESVRFVPGGKHVMVRGLEPGVELVLQLEFAAGATAMVRAGT